MPEVTNLRLKGLARRFKLLRFVGKRPERIFESIYRNNGFGGVDSASGSGSDLIQTATIRRELPNLIREYGISSMLDAPCGDFHWMNTVNIELESYVGIDVVRDVVNKARASFETEERKFLVGDLSTDSLPTVDLIFCRDCLVHLSNDTAMAVLRNFARSQSKYLLTTTFPKSRRNKNIITGSWRPINLRLAPFNLPEPVRLITENCTEQASRYGDKSMGLWSIDSIRSALRW